ncbi:MlaE family ABC transporter permease [Arachidicoccus sp.]|uniref:MlaE family ABC transporter permease n=1 Tax=Arachidicoccus sp. TaxID=1872624 RepID=UPI003D1DBFA7
MFSKPDNWRMYRKQFFEQCNFVGMQALPVVAIISLFLGMVMTLQAAYMLNNPIVPKSVIATVVRDSMLLEIAPTGISAILAGIVGFKITSEIGYMRLYEQIDAMEMMGVQSLNYIVLPRIAAAMLTIPCLIIFALTLSMFGGYVVAVFSSRVPIDYYLTGLITNFKPYEVLVAAVKTITFSFVISSVACYLGYYFNGSSVELSRTSTRSVTLNCVLILALDYIITSYML